MLQTAKIKIRDLKELQDLDILISKNTITPLKKCKKPKFASTTSKKQKNKQEHDDASSTNNNYIKTNTITKTIQRKKTKFSIENTPANQKTIDSYFTSCAKTFEIKRDPAQASTSLRKHTENVTNTKKTKKTPINKRIKTGRKRLFHDTDTEPSSESNYQVECKRGTTKLPAIIDCITIDDSDNDNEEEVHIKTENVTLASPSSPQQISRTPPNKKTNGSAISLKVKRTQNSKTRATHDSATSLNDKPSQTSKNSTSEISFGLKMSHTSGEKTKVSHTSDSMTVRVPSSISTGASFSRRKPKPCPSYKIIEDTTFAVDAFQFGYIENVTHYFLTHFHADHYIGLIKSFAKPLFVSPITARLLRTFIPIEEQYIHVLELNESYTIDNIEITALDANHCPGAILLVFKFLDTGKCILHTGDFRAWHGMESEPIFWNNDIHTIYLDTTYISDKYAFCSQDESLEKAKVLIEKCQSKNPNKKILYVCGSYIVGKEKFWSKLAEIYELKVWAEGIRYKALKAINDEEYNKILVEEPLQANMHIIAIGKLTYFEMVEYFKSYEQYYDVILAIRPSGWEKDTKPRLSGKINLIGIEYSEHSSYDEMKRFVKYLKPQKVISTVPVGKDLMITAKIPEQWYKYDKLKSCTNYQPTIDSLLPQKKASNIKPPNLNKGGVEIMVSPLVLKQNKKLNKARNKTNEENCDNYLLKSLNINTEIEVEEEIFIQNSNNLENNENLPQEHSAITNKSSEEFERNDFVIKYKKLVNNTGKLKKRNLNIKDKEKEEKLDNNLEVNTINKTKVQYLELASENCFETPNIELIEKKAPVIKKHLKSKKTCKLNKNLGNNTSQEDGITLKENNLAEPVKEQIETNGKSDITTFQHSLRTRSQSSASNNKNFKKTKNKSSSLTTELDFNNKTSLKQTEIQRESCTFKDNTQAKSLDNITSQKSQSQTSKLLDEEQKNYDNNSSSTISSKQTENSKLTNGEQKNHNTKSSSSNKSIQQTQTQSQTSKLLDEEQKNYDNNSSSTISSKQTENSKLTNGEQKNHNTKSSSSNKSIQQTQYQIKNNEITKSLSGNENRPQIKTLTEQENNYNNSQSQRYPLFKSTTTTSRESISSIELTKPPTNSQTSKTKSNKRIYPYTKSTTEISSDEINEPQKPKRIRPLKSSTTTPTNSQTSKTKSKKRINLYPKSTSELSSDEISETQKPKRSKRLKSSQKLNTKDILTKIIEENKEDLDTLNCSQLACKVMETMYKENPDNNQDHIPIELLSDDNDDENSWQTAENFEQNISLQNEMKPKITQFEANFNQNTNSSENLLKSPTNSLESQNSVNYNFSNSKGNYLSNLNDQELSYLPSTSKAALNFKTSNLNKITNSQTFTLANVLENLKSKPQFNFKDITITKIEEETIYNHTNCSQLAGLVVDMHNKQNPDNSKDHIPIELLSDADDDWM